MAERTFRVFLKDRPSLLITCPQHRIDQGAVTTDIRACWEGDADGQATYTSISMAVKALGDKSINPNKQCYLDASRTIAFGELSRNLDKLDFVDVEHQDAKLVAARRLLEQKAHEHDQAKAAAQVAAQAAATKLAEKNAAAASVKALEEAARKRTRERARLREEVKRKADAERQAEAEERQAAAQQARAAAKRAKLAAEKQQMERQLADLDAQA